MSRCQSERELNGKSRAYWAARRYVAGTTLSDALATVKRLETDGLAPSLDLFGRASRTSTPHRAGVRDTWMPRRYNRDGRRCLSRGRPLPLGIDVSVDCFRRGVERIVQRLPAGSRLEVSAEVSSRTDRILSAVPRLARDGAPVMPTLQKR